MNFSTKKKALKKIVEFSAAKYKSSARKCEFPKPKYKFSTQKYKFSVNS